MHRNLRQDSSGDCLVRVLDAVTHDLLRDFESGFFFADSSHFFSVAASPSILPIVRPEN
jgi:hypothetical protein